MAAHRARPRLLHREPRRRRGVCRRGRRAGRRPRARRRRTDRVVCRVVHLGGQAGVARRRPPARRRAPARPRARPPRGGPTAPPWMPTTCPCTDEGLDDRLALLFVACDEAISPASRMVLALRVVCGLTVPEIAGHLGIQETAAAARLTRAKRALAEARGTLPRARGDRARRAACRSCIACVAGMFTVAHRTVLDPADALADTGRQALSIADALVAAYPDDTEVRGLRAVIRLGLARRPGRVDDSGTGLALDEVDRTRWDGALLRAGLDDATLAAAGDGRFAIEAAIAGLHSSAPSFERTDWPRIVQLYGALERPLALPLRPGRPSRRHGPRASSPHGGSLARRGGGRARVARERAPRHTPAVTRASPSPTSSGARDGGSRRRRATATSPRSCRPSRCGASASRAGRHSPVTPSTASRRKSAWPLWRAYSSIMCSRIQRRRELLVLLARQRRRPELESALGERRVDVAPGLLDRLVHDPAQLLGAVVARRRHLPVAVGVPVGTRPRLRHRAAVQHLAEPARLVEGDVLEQRARASASRARAAGRAARPSAPRSSGGGCRGGSRGRRRGSWPRRRRGAGRCARSAGMSSWPPTLVSEPRKPPADFAPPASTLVRVPSSSQWVAFLVASILFIQVPGPSLLFTIGRALTVGRREALLSVVGNAIGVTAQAALRRRRARRGRRREHHGLHGHQGRRRRLRHLARHPGDPAPARGARGPRGAGVGQARPRPAHRVRRRSDQPEDDPLLRRLPPAVHQHRARATSACRWPCSARSSASWRSAATASGRCSPRGPGSGSPASPHRLDKLGATGGVMMVGLGATMLARE